MLAPPSTFFIFLLLIVKSGMDAVSFAAKHAMRPSCLFCTDTLLLLLILWLDDGLGSMTEFFVFTGMGDSLVVVMFFLLFILGCCWGGVFIFFLL